MDWWAGMNTYGSGSVGDMSHIDATIFDPWIQCEDLDLGTILHQANSQPVSSNPSSTSASLSTTHANTTLVSSSSLTTNAALQPNSFTSLGYPQLVASNSGGSTSGDSDSINHQHHQQRAGSISDDSHITSMQAQYLYTNQVADNTSMIPIHGNQREHIDHQHNDDNNNHHQHHQHHLQQQQHHHQQQQQQQINSFTSTKQNLFNIITSAAVDVIPPPHINNNNHESRHTSISSSQCSSSLSSTSSSHLSSIESSPLNNHSNYLSSPSPILLAGAVPPSIIVDARSDESSSPGYMHQQNSRRIDGLQARSSLDGQPTQKQICRDQVNNSYMEARFRSDRRVSSGDIGQRHVHMTTSSSSDKMDSKNDLQLRMSIAAISAANKLPSKDIAAGNDKDLPIAVSSHPEASGCRSKPASKNAAATKGASLFNQRHATSLGVDNDTTNEIVSKSKTISSSSSIGSDSLVSPSMTGTSNNRSVVSNQQPVQKVRRCRHITDYVLAEEEKRLLIKEGYTDFPMTCQSRALSKSEERILRKIRRKIRNKKSAQCSRQRKKEYVEDLEKKYAAVVRENEELKKTLDKIQGQQQAQFNPQQVPSNDPNLIALEWKDLFVNPKGPMQLTNVPLANVYN